MKNLNQYMQEIEQDLPQVGDVFIFESEEGELVESHIVEVQEDGIVVASDQQAEALLSLDGYLLEAIARYGAVGTSPGMGYSQNEDADMGPGDHLDRIENGQLGDNSALAEEEPTPPDANHNDPLLSKAVDDAAVPAMESDDLLERLLQLANVAEGSLNEAAINSKQDALNTLTNLRAISKRIETGEPYDGNLANLYVNDVYDVYSWLDNHVNVNDPKLAPILANVIAVRKQAKDLETKGGSGQNRHLANQIINALYPLIQWIQMNASDQQGVAEAGSWIGKDTDKPAHLRKAEYEKSQAPDSPAKKFRVPGDPSTPAAQRKIRPGDAQDKKPTTSEEHELSELRRHAGIMEDPTEEESMPQQSAVASEPQSPQSSEPGSAAAKAFEGESNTAESPVAQAIVQRIISQHTDLLAKHGPEQVGDAVDRVARSVGKVEEIGSSDVSGWVREVEQELQTSESLEEIRRRSGLGSRRGHALDDYEKMWRQRDQYWNQSSPPSDSEFKNRDEEDDPNYRRQQKDKFKDIDEAEYHGRNVPLGKPMQGDVKKFKVYVKDPKTGNVKKVNFGDKTMRIKKSNPARRKSFRARHNCDNPGPRTKARYWSCRKW